jgi:hypothetical protein
MDVVPDNLAPILSGENRGVGVCPYETFVWRDLTVQEHMLVMGMVYGAWVGPFSRVSLYTWNCALQQQLLAMVVPCLLENIWRRLLGTLRCMCSLCTHAHKALAATAAHHVGPMPCYRKVDAACSEPSCMLPPVRCVLRLL